MLVQDKVVIVTGAARGIGQAYAVALARDGARVVACDVKPCDETVSLVEQAGGQVVSAVTDVTKDVSTRALAELAVSRFGAIHGLVNNAALYGQLKGGKFDTIPEDDWDAAMNVNVKGVWNCCKAVVGAMRQAGGGSIVNISSLAATYGMPGRLHYTASKAAVIGLTRGMARELGRDRIRVNAVAPAAVMTEGTQEFFSGNVEKALDVVRAGQAIQLTLEADDLTGTILYLLSDASKLVTGQTISVDGGTIMN
jgi:NAD(P)-dependent dehydrogenase (short-subunit alcohol dehydrogenase family)